MKNLSEFAARSLAFAEAGGLLSAGQTVLCALSGGSDSMALLSVLLEWRSVRPLTVRAAHYNHQLRGAESQRDEDFVSHWCQTLNVPLTIGRGDVARTAAQTGRGLEETARTMRYDFLEQTARQTGAAAIATAHNADDNAETVLLHLVRGAGLEGLTGIPPRRGAIIRPLLTASRTSIEGYLRDQGLPHVEDSSNQDPAFARNRLRQEVLPVLRAINPGFAATLAANLVHLRADEDFLNALARPSADTAQPVSGGLRLPCAALTQSPRPVAVRVVRQTLERLDRWQISAVHLNAILALADGSSPSAQLQLPRNLTVQRRYDALFLLSQPPQASTPTGFAPVVLTQPGTVTLSHGWQVEVCPTLCPDPPSQGPYLCCVAEASFPLTLRPRQTGDQLRLPGRPEKSLKKWYIDQKIPRALRNSLPVAADTAGLLAAAGLGPAAARCARPGQPALRLRFVPPQVPPSDPVHESTYEERT